MKERRRWMERANPRGVNGSEYTGAFRGDSFLRSPNLEHQVRALS
jgi:hypothetical protein